MMALGFGGGGGGEALNMVVSAWPWARAGGGHNGRGGVPLLVDVTLVTCWRWSRAGGDGPDGPNGVGACGNQTCI